MAYLQLPDGRYFEIMPGESPAQARIAAMQKYPEAFGGGQPQPQQGQPSGFFPALGEGARNALSNITTGTVGAWDPQAAGIAALKDAKKGPGAQITNFEDVRNAYTNEGTLAGLGKFGAFARDQIASNLPQMGATLAGAKLGAMGGAAVAPALGPLAPVAPIAGGALGAFLPSLVMQAGSNIERQAVEQDKEGKPVDISRGAAYGAAVPQAALDSASTLFMLGKFGVAKLGGKPIQEALKTASGATQQELLKAAQQTLMGALGKGAVRGAVGEMPTELAQQVLERAQAGLPLTGDEANREYMEVLASSGVVGGAFGGAGGVQGRSYAKTEAPFIKNRMAKEAAAAAAKQRELDTFTGNLENRPLGPESGGIGPGNELSPESLIPGFAQAPTVNNAAPPAAPAPKAPADGMLGGFYVGDTANKAAATREAVTDQDQYNGMFLAESDRKNILAQQDASRTAEDMQAAERAAQEQETARLEAEDAAADERLAAQRAERRGEQGVMFALPNLKMTPEGAIDMGFVREAQSTAETGVPTAAFAKVTGLPAGFMKADVATQLAMAEKRHAEVVSELKNLARRMGKEARPSQVDARRRQLEAQMQLLYGYGLNAPNAAANPSGGAPVIAGAADLQPSYEAPYLHGGSPQEQAIQAMRANAEAPPQVTPQVTPAPQRQLGIPGVGNAPASQVGPLAQEMAQMEADKTRAENVLRTSPDDIETLDKLEAIKSPFQQARERQMAIRAREELKALLTDPSRAWYHEGDRADLERAFDILSQPAPQKSEGNTRAKERLLEAALAQVQRLKANLPNSDQASDLRAALQPFTMPDTQTRDMFSGVRDENSLYSDVTPEGLATAKKFRDQTERQKQGKAQREMEAARQAARQVAEKDWRKQVSTLNLLFKNAERAAKAAIEQANSKAETLFALQDKLATVDKILDKIDRADPTTGVPSALATAESEGMPEGYTPQTPQWATNLRRQIEPARDRLREDIYTLVDAVNKKLADTARKTEELRRTLNHVKANPPAIRALKERIAQREAELELISQAAGKLRAKQAIEGRPAIPSAPYQTGQKLAAAQLAPIPGTQMQVRQTKDVVEAPFRDEQGNRVLQERTTVTRPADKTDTGLNWGKSPQQKALEAEAEAIRKRGEQAARMAEARASKKEGQRGQTQDPFSTQKAASAPTVAREEGDDIHHDKQERLLNAVKQRVGERDLTEQTPKQARDHVVYAALDLLENPEALGISPTHAQALKWYLSALDGLTQDVKITVGWLPEAGRYIPSENTVNLSPTASVYTLVHELAHAATFNRLQLFSHGYMWEIGDRLYGDIREATPEQIIKMASHAREVGMEGWTPAQLTALENLAKAWGETKKVSSEYGATNMMEFVAEWYADPAFAGIASEAASKADLADIKQGKLSTVRRMLKKIMDRVRDYMADFLGLKNEARTAFYRISDSIAALHDKSAELGTSGFLAREANMSHLPESLQELSRTIQSDQHESNWQYMKRNLTGLGFRTAVLDRGAGYETFLNERRQSGAVSDAEWAARAMHYRQADLTSHFVHNVLGGGRMSFDENGIAYVSPSEDSLIKTVKILADAGVPEPERTLQLYMVAKRALRVGTQRLSNVLPKEWTLPRLQEAAKLDEQYPALREAAAVERRRNDSLIDLLVQSGRMNAEEGTRLKSFGDYVPFYRAEEDGSLWMVIDDQTKYAIGQIDDPAELKALRGGDQRIRPYFENAITNTRYIISSALRNNALRSAVKMMGDGKMGFAVGSKLNPRTTLTYYEGGEQKYFQIDPVYVDDDQSVHNDYPGIPAEMVAQAFVATRYAMPAALKLMQYPARWLRYMVTRNPLYTARQLLREPLTSSFTSGNNTIPLVGAVQALIGAKQSYKDAKASLRGYGIAGGHVLTGTSEDMRVMLNELATGKTGFAKAMAFMDELAMNADLATRETIYDSALKQGMSKPEAALLALESMNFTRHGAMPAVQVASMLVPFLNAQLQGLDVLYRSARGKMAFNDRLNIKNKFMARAAMMSGLAMLYAAAMADEEPWKTASEQERDMNWFVPVPGVEGAWIKVPVNFEIGYLFKALPERMVALSNGDDNAMSVLKALGSFAAQTAPNPIPQAVRPLLEWWTNFSFFTGRPIQTERMLAMDPSQRFNERTTELAKMAGRSAEFELPGGQKIGLSPVVLEHFIRGYASQLGMLVLQTASGAAETMDGATNRTGRPARELHETPLLGPMLANTRGYGPTNRFYDIKTQIDQRAATLRDMKLTDPASAAQYQQEHAQDVRLASMANRVSNKLNEYRKQQARVWYSQSLSPEQKQEQLRQLRDAEIALVNQFNRQYAQINAQ